MRKEFILVGLFIFYPFPFVKSKPSVSEDFSHRAILDRRGKVWLYWKLNDTFITFEVHGQTMGWVGVGISPNGDMANSDINVGWVKNGNALITDRHAHYENSYPPKDPQQNVELLAGSECDGWTVIKFRRQIAACEADVDRPITGDTLKVIWALGEKDPEDDLQEKDQHGTGPESRGRRHLYLLGKDSTPKDDTNVKTMSIDLLNRNITVPPIHAYSNCRLLRLPKWSKKYHIIRIEPLIEERNLGRIRHIFLHHCLASEAPEDSMFLGKSFKCITNNMLPDLSHRCEIIFEWSMGGGTLEFPEHVGFPIGGENGANFFAMETNYDNPDLRADIVDRSGLRLVYTDQPRKHDAGIIEVGHEVFPYAHLIPPKAESFLSYAECSADCLAAGMKLIGVNSINIFGTLLHSHSLAKAMILRHLTSQSSSELRPIAQDISYDVNYQVTRIFSKEVQFNIDDSLQIVCNYNSEERKNFTLGGLSKRDEMCLAYVYYYPRTPIAVCTTSPETHEVYTFFGVSGFRKLNPSHFGTLEDVKITSPQQYAGQTLNDIVNRMNWDQNSARRLSQFLRNVTRRKSCHSIVNVNITVSSDGLAPNILEPYQEAIPATCEALSNLDAQRVQNNDQSCNMKSTTPSKTTSSLHSTAGNILLIPAMLSILLSTNLVLN